MKRLLVILLLLPALVWAQGSWRDNPAGSTLITTVGTLTTGTWSAGNVTTPLLTAIDAVLVKTAPAIAAGVLTLNLATSNFFVVPLGANITTMTVSNAPATAFVASFKLLTRADGTPRTIVYPVTTVWKNNGGVAPTPTSTNGKCDEYTALTYDGGTTWYFTIDFQNFTCTA